MDSLRQKEELLFRKWEKRLEGLGLDKELFCYDGLHYLGKAVKDPCWRIAPTAGLAERKWDSSPIRCLFLTKDHNLQGEDEGVDFREESGLDNGSDKMYWQFYMRYTMLLYGLYHYDPVVGKCPSLDEVQDRDMLLEAFQQEIPVVRMNTKKIAGGSSLDKGDLFSHIQRDRDLINEQMDLYDANVFVVCDGSEFGSLDNLREEPRMNPIMALMLERYTDLRLYKYAGPAKEYGSYSFIFFSQGHHVIVIWEYHPSHRVSYKEYYAPLSHFEDFMGHHPGFLLPRNG